MKKFAVIISIFSAAPILANQTATTTTAPTVSTPSPTAVKTDAITTPEKVLTLTKVGSGIRQKKVLFITVDAYYATLFVNDITKFKRDNNTALASIKDMELISFELDFKHDVDGKRIAEGFGNSLKKNNVQETEAIKQFKAEIEKNGEVKKGHKVIINLNKNGLVKLTLNQKQVEIKGDNETMTSIASIWLGETTDNELKKLKEAIIAGK